LHVDAGRGIHAGDAIVTKRRVAESTESADGGEQLIAISFVKFLCRLGLKHQRKNLGTSAECLRDQLIYIRWRGHKGRGVFDQIKALYG